MRRSDEPASSSKYIRFQGAGQTVLAGPDSSPRGSHRRVAALDGISVFAIEGADGAKTLDDAGECLDDVVNVGVGVVSAEAESQ